MHWRLTETLNKYLLFHRCLDSRTEGAVLRDHCLDAPSGLGKFGKSVVPQINSCAVLPTANVTRAHLLVNVAEHLSRALLGG